MASRPLPGSATTVGEELGQIVPGLSLGAAVGDHLTATGGQERSTGPTPDDAGFGVTILTPGLTRSSQPLMPCGLPFRTTMTTTESATHALGSRPVLPARIDQSSPDEAWLTSPSSQENSMAKSSLCAPRATAHFDHPRRRRTPPRRHPLPSGVPAGTASEFLAPLASFGTGEADQMEGRCARGVRRGKPVPLPPTQPDGVAQSVPRAIAPALRLEALRRRAYLTRIDPDS